MAAAHAKKRSKQQAPQVLCHPKWIWHGHAGHFIGARDCRFRLHTHVAVTDKSSWCVSTVGNYHPRAFQRLEGELTEVGLGRLFETMVFKYDEKKERNISWSELAMQGSKDYDQAVRNHMLMCWAWEVPSDQKELHGIIEQARTDDTCVAVLMDRLKETGFLPM